MHRQRHFIHEFQAAGERATRSTNAFGDCINFAALARKERVNLVGFAEIPSAKDDRRRFVRARRGQ